MKPAIVFFGTGPVSLACLEGIQDAFSLEAIITKPDRRAPGGRPHAHPVRAWAEAHGVAVHQVADQAALTTLFKQQRFSSPVGLVVDFGMIIGSKVIAAFPGGIINSHFSLLPLLRGADPISFAILEGHERSGVSLMKIVPKLDEGELIAQETLALPADITTPALTEALGAISNRLLRDRLPRYIKGDITPWPQTSPPPPTYTRRLTKADGRMDWQRPAVELERAVRALVGWPGSRTVVCGREATVTAARVAAQLEVASVVEGATHADFDTPGAVLRGDGRLFVVAGAGVLEVLQLTPAGKRSMAAAEFLRGLPH